jgi:septal ring factor EnvC (AmiA/AmiB activator)
LTGGAVQQTYAEGDGFVQMSFLQVRSDIVSNTRAVEVVRHLAAAHHSKAFFQLASNMETAIKAADAPGLDPFASVKGLLDGMMDKIQRELEADASKKSFCNKEMAESNANLEDKQDELEKLNSELDVLRAWSKKLKREVAGLQKEISLVTKTQAEMDVLRFKEKALYKKNEPELAQGLEGVKMAMKVLREYYAKDDKSHDSKDGAGSSIIGMLEVVQSDF